MPSFARSAPDRRDWWLGIVLVCVVVAAHALFPRYEWRQAANAPFLIRIDHWRGSATVVRPTPLP